MGDTEPRMHPSEELDRATDFAAARSFLLRTEYASGPGWCTHEVEPELLNPRLSQQTGQHSQFALHQTYELPDCPPVEGAQSSPLHRFVLADDVAIRLNAQLAREAQQQSWGPKQLFGETKSNVGGFHSNEEAFLTGLDAQSLACEWYGQLLSDVVLPALRALDGECAGGRESVNADGVPVEGRITGWLNVSGVHAFNALHRHGTDVAWSLVYYVSSGEDASPDAVGSLPSAPQPTAAAGDARRGGMHPWHALEHWFQPDATSSAESANAACAAIRAATSDCAGALLIRTEANPQTHVHGYFPIKPRAGELWCFPGYMAHTVMPRKLKKAPNCRAVHANDDEGGAGLLQLAADLIGKATGQQQPRARISVRSRMRTVSLERVVY